MKSVRKSGILADEPNHCGTRPMRSTGNIVAMVESRSGQPSQHLKISSTSVMRIL